MLDQFSVFGVTVTLDRAVTVLFDPTGDPILVSDREFSILSMTPESRVQSGAQAHGAMVNMMPGTDQGFDAWLGEDHYASRWAYDASLNVDPGATGQPIHIPRGWQGSIVKAVRRDGLQSHRQWQTIDRYVVISVVAERPPEGAFRPPMGGTHQLVLGTAAQAEAHFDVLQTIRLGGFRTGAVATGHSYQGHRRTKRQLLFYGHGGGQNHRRGDIPHEPGGQTYSGNYGGTGHQRAMGLIWLHGTATRDQKREDYYRAIKHGIDLYGIWLEGWRGNAGAGQFHGYLPYIYYAAFALGSEEILHAAQRMRSNLNGQVRWTPADWIGQPTDWPGAGSTPPQFYKTYFAEDLGKPTWYMVTPSSQNIAGHLFARYKRQSTAASMFETAAICLLQNGPGGITGEEALRHGPDDLSNDRAAIIPWLDRWHLWSQGTSDSIPNEARWLWENLRSVIDRPLWQGTPDHPPERDLSFSRGPGWVRIDADSAMGAANPRVSRIDARVSNDGGYSWHYIEGYRPGRQIAAQNGAEHLLQVRQVNALGAGPWSANYRFDTDMRHPFGRLVPNGPVAAEAPAFAPRIVYRPYPGWAGSNLFHEDYDGGAGIYRVFAGWGPVTGGVPTEAFYQWLRNGSPIEGAEREYWLSAEDGGQGLSVRVTLENEHGRVTQDSPAIRIPEALIERRAGELFRCDFTNRVDPRVRAFIASLFAEENASNIGGRGHLDAVMLIADAGPGAFVGEKVSAWPAITGYVDLSADIGRTVVARVSMAVGSVFPNSGSRNDVGTWSGPENASLAVSVCADNSGAGAERVEGRSISSRSRIPLIRTLTTQPFQVTPDRPWLQIRSSNSTNVGGGGGGNPNLIEVVIEQIDG